MATTIVNVTGPVVAPNGNDLTSGTVKFALTGWDTDTVSDETIHPTVVTAVIDGNGDFTAALWPNDRGSQATRYRVSVTGETSAGDFETDLGLISVPEDGAPHDLEDLLAAGAPTVNAVYMGLITQDQYDAVIEAAQDVEDAKEAAEEAADRAALYDGLHADTVTDLANLTDEDVDVGDLVPVTDTGMVVERVSSGGDLDYTGSGGVQFDVVRIPENGLAFDTEAEMLASTDTWWPEGAYVRTREKSIMFEVAASSATDHHVTTAGGVKLYHLTTYIETPSDGRAMSAMDIAHYSQQGSNPVTSPTMVTCHDYTDASRAIQVDKVGGDFATGGYIMGLRRGSNHIRREDKDGTYVADAGFLRCSYDVFEETAEFTGEISGNILTVSAVASGSIGVGNFLLWGSTDNGTTIVSQLTGSAGSTGTYELAVRGDSSATQTVASTTMTAKAKSEVLGFYIGKDTSFGKAADPFDFLTAKADGGYYAYKFSASNETQFIASFESASGGVLNVQDAVSGTRTDIIAPANQTSGIRIEATGGSIDLAPKTGSQITVRGPMNSPNGSDINMTAVGATLKLNGSNGVQSLAPFRPGQYNVAGLPSASSYTGHVVFVSDGDSGSPCLAVSDGSDWLRIALGTAVSST